jgi:hypothetical protein
MPKLSYYCLLLTDGQAPASSELAASDFKVVALPGVPRLDQDAELFGPFAHELSGALAEAKAAYLFYGTREVNRDAGSFFAVAHRLLASAVDGVRGYGLDVLRLWPFPLAQAGELPEDPLAEDLFSVGLYERADEGFRAETFGLAKLGQREIVFEFRGRDLVDEAALMCGRLADYALAQSRRVGHAQTMSFGFDRVSFRASEGPDAGGPLRGWHAPFVQRVLPDELFGGVGQLEVHTYVPMSEQLSADLSLALRRAFEQRQVVEALELSGEGPHQSTEVRACACAGGEHGLRGFRQDPGSVRDSGWTFTCARPSPGTHEIGTGPLGGLVKRLPQILKYLSLPPGSVIEWHGERVAIDVIGGSGVEDDDEDSLA